jgi:DNA topoisomerase-1
VETKSFDAKEVQTKELNLDTHNQWPPKESSKVLKQGAEKDRLVLTPVGEQVLKYLTHHFDDLFQYKFTANMESRLDAISEGSEPWKDVLRQTWESYKDRYEVQKAEKGSVTATSRSIRKEFGNGLVAVLGKKGPLLLQESPDGDKEKTIFYGWPEGAEVHTLTLEQAQACVEKSTKEKAGESLGIHEGHPILRKQGKFGTYASWNGKTAACQNTDTLEQVIQALTSKQTNVLRTVGQFEIRDGQYGPYMFKTAITGASRKFVSVPKHINIQEVTEPQLIAIFQHELQQKARSGTYGASRGQAEGSDAKASKPTRGRGSWRGKR